MQLLPKVVPKRVHIIISLFWVVSRPGPKLSTSRAMPWNKWKLETSIWLHIIVRFYCPCYCCSCYCGDMALDCKAEMLSCDPLTRGYSPRAQYQIHMLTRGTIPDTHADQWPFGLRTMPGTFQYQVQNIKYTIPRCVYNYSLHREEEQVECRSRDSWTQNSARSKQILEVFYYWPDTIPCSKCWILYNELLHCEEEQVLRSTDSGPQNAARFWPLPLETNSIGILVVLA